jgi:hypothetical protein
MVLKKGINYLIPHKSHLKGLRVPIKKDKREILKNRKVLKRKYLLPKYCKKKRLKILILLIINFNLKIIALSKNNKI